MDVHVVGGGVAGGTCAKILAKEGLRVLLSEEDEVVGHPKHCTGILSVRAFNEAGGYADIILNELRGSTIVGPNGVQWHVRRPEVQAYVVDRPALDRKVVEEALSEGATLETRKIRRREDLRGRYVVGADGPHSTVARIHGMKPLREVVIGYQEVIRVKTEPLDEVVVYLDQDLFPGFFGWRVPLDEKRSIVGFGVRGRSASVVMKTFKRRWNLRGKVEERFGGIIPVAPREKLVRGNVLLVGDAAGQTKATSGGGVYYAVRGARAAAEAILAEDPNLYERTYSDLRKELDYHRLLRVLYNLFPNILIGGAMALGRFIGLPAIIERRGDMDYATAIFK